MPVLGDGPDCVVPVGRVLAGCQVGKRCPCADELLQRAEIIPLVAREGAMGGFDKHIRRIADRPAPALIPNPPQ